MYFFKNVISVIILIVRVFCYNRYNIATKMAIRNTIVIPFVKKGV